jgi:hypothetical protein
LRSFYRGISVQFFDYLPAFLLVTRLDEIFYDPFCNSKFMARAATRQDCASGSAQAERHHVVARNRRVEICSAVEKLQGVNLAPGLRRVVCVAADRLIESVCLVMLQRSRHASALFKPKLLPPAFSRRAHTLRANAPGPHLLGPGFAGQVAQRGAHVYDRRGVHLRDTRFNHA